MFELRLTDPDGYTVPGTAHTVTAEHAPTTKARLLAVNAPQDAAVWDRPCTAGYRVHTIPIGR